LKVVQGLEAELTNQFLIALAECATDPTIDNETALARCLAGEQPGTNPPPRKGVCDICFNPSFLVLNCFELFIIYFYYYFLSFSIIITIITILIDKQSSIHDESCRS
jgi:hypothetical protein